MPSAPFPERPDSSKLFAREAVIDAVLPLSRLERLARSLYNDEGQVAVHLVFGHDAQHRRTLSGELSTRLTLECQRCLQPVQMTIDGSLELLIVDDEETRAELEQSSQFLGDIIVDEKDELDVLMLLEDELLLSLPMVPMHAEQDCNAILKQLNEEAAAVQDVQVNPFAALAALQQTGQQENGRHSATERSRTANRIEDSAGKSADKAADQGTEQG